MQKKSIAQLLFGTLLVALGIGFLLDALGVADFSRLLRDWWPLAIIAVGLVSLLSNPRVIVWPLVIIVIGVLLLLRQLDIVTFNIWNLIWPSAIILIGLALVFGRKGKQAEINDDNIDLFAAFSGHETRSTSQKFTGGKITAMFGGVDLDLRGAKIDKQASIEVFTAFGGADITVPEGWLVKTKGLPVLGGWEDKTHKPSAAEKAPVLTIQGTCLLGGVTVKN